MDTETIMLKGHVRNYLVSRSYTGDMNGDQKRRAHNLIVMRLNDIMAEIKAATVKLNTDFDRLRERQT